MIKDVIQESINIQINAEFFSSYLYLSMAAYFDNLNLKGFANWMRVQAQEEMVHGLKFYAYLTHRSGRVILDQIAAPRVEWGSPLEVFEYTYKHEQSVTERINKLVDLSIKESDHASHAMLQWFVTEQVEEESTSDNIVQKLKLIGTEKSSLFLLDQELAARVFVPPVPPIFQ